MGKYQLRSHKMKKTGLLVVVVSMVFLKLRQCC